MRIVEVVRDAPLPVVAPPTHVCLRIAERVVESPVQKEVSRDIGVGLCSPEGLRYLFSADSAVVHAEDVDAEVADLVRHQTGGLFSGKNVSPEVEHTLSQRCSLWIRKHGGVHRTAIDINRIFTTDKVERGDYVVPITAFENSSAAASNIYGFFISNGRSCWRP